MADKPQKTCSRCQHLFSCRPEAISQCQCATVVLSEAQRQAIQRRYHGCLCAACLQDLRDEIEEGSA